MTKRPLLIAFINMGLGGVQRKIVDICNYTGIHYPDLPIVLLLRNREEFDLTSKITNQNVMQMVYKDWRDWQKVKIPLLFPLYIFFQVLKYNPRAILSFLDFISLPIIWSRMLLFWRKSRLIIGEDHYASKIVPQFVFGRLRVLLMKIFYPLADKVVTCTQANVEDLVNYFGLDRKKVSIIANWTGFKPIKVVKEYDLIYIGRIVKTKNLGLLVKAVALLKKRRMVIKVCLAGYGADEERIRKMIKDNGLTKQFTIIPPTIEADKLIAKGKAFVCCSQIKAEGFPMTILEAMAVGVPVFSRCFAGAGDFLSDRVNCFLFNNETDLANLIIEVYKNEQLRETVVKNALALVRSKHSVANIEEYLRELGI